MTLDEFYTEVAETFASKRGMWRYGQTLYNALMDRRPDIAHRLCGSEDDPFYAREATDSRVMRAVVVIASLW